MTMKIEEINQNKTPIVKVDNKLNKYKDQVHFKKKLDKANEFLDRVGLPVEAEQTLQNNKGRIRIKVNKQMDGYTFSISPSIREFIKRSVPNSHPANNIFIAYDTQSNFEEQYGNIESHIYIILMGVEKIDDIRRFGEIEFIDNETGNLLNRIAP